MIEAREEDGFEDLFSLLPLCPSYSSSYCYPFLLFV